MRVNSASLIWSSMGFRAGVLEGADARLDVASVSAASACLATCKDRLSLSILDFEKGRRAGRGEQKQQSRRCLLA